MPEPLSQVARIAAAQPGLQLLLLHGSRARGNAHTHSDWDFAYLAGPGFDPDALIARLAEALHTDEVDLADLARTSGLLRYKAASDGIAVYQQTPELFEQFRLDAISAWCEMAPVLGPAYAEQLGRLTA